MRICVAARRDKDRGSHEHSDRCQPESPVPAICFANVAAQKRSNRRAQVHAHVEDREAAVAPRVAMTIKRTNDGGDVRFEESVAADQEGKRCEEGRAALDQDNRLASDRDRKIPVHSHQQVAEGHEQAAENHRPPLPQEPVGQQTAEEGRHVNQRRVGAVHGIGVFVAVAQKALRHVEDQQRPHAVVGEPLPHLGKEEREQPGRVAKHRGAVGAKGIAGLAHQ